MDISSLRKLLSLDPNDALSRFALGKRLLETADDPAQLAEPIEHLTFANTADPSHLATYHLLGQALLKHGDTAQAKQVLTAGIERANAVGHGMGHDLGPLMAGLLGECS